MFIKDENGNEIEVFTKEDAENMAKSHAEQVQKNLEEQFNKKEAELKSSVTLAEEKLLQTEKDLEAAIASGGGNTAQIERLRKERDEAKTGLGSLQTQFEQQIKSIRDEVFGDYKTEILKKYANGDKDLENKMLVEFNNYKPGETSKAAIEERMAKAYQLVSGDKKSPSVFSSVGGMSGSFNSGSYTQNTNKTTENEVKIGSLLGISDDDRKAVEDYKKANGYN